MLDLFGCSCYTGSCYGELLRRQLRLLGRYGRPGHGGASTIRFKAKALKRPAASAGTVWLRPTTTSAIRAAPKSKTVGTAEMDSIDIAIDEVRVKGVICPKCGGYGGEQLNLSRA